MTALPVVAGTSFGNPELVETGNFRQASLVVVDGTPHIAAVGPTGLWHFTRAGGTWIGEKITHFAGDSRHATHEQPSIAVDPSDGSLTVAFAKMVARVSIGGCGSYFLNYVTNRSGSWSGIRRIGNEFVSSSCVQNPDLTVRDGHIYVAGQVMTVPAPDAPQKIRYLTNVTGGWSSENLGGSGRPSLELDDSGIPHIGGLRFTPPFNPPPQDFHNVWYARGTSPTGGFVRDQVARVKGITSEAFLALTTSSKPRVAWSDGDGLHYASRQGGDWSNKLIGPGLLIKDLQIDNAGMVHATAFAGHQLMYVTGPQNGGPGDFEATAITSAAPSRNSEVGIGPNGRVQVVFQRNTPDARLWWVRSAAL
jgi:hypothetical protein